MYVDALDLSERQIKAQSEIAIDQDINNLCGYVSKYILTDGPVEFIFPGYHYECNA